MFQNETKYFIKSAIIIKKERKIKMYQETFASKLKKARKDIGFTQDEVSRETKIPRSTIANWERGRVQPDIESIGILADFYEVSVDWLIGTKGNKENKKS